MLLYLKPYFKFPLISFKERISQNIQNRINNSLYTKFINLKYGIYINENSPRILRLLSQEAVKIGNQLITPLISIINEIILLFFVSLLIFVYDPYLGCIVFVSSVLLILIFSTSVSNNVRNFGIEYAKNNNYRIKNISETFRAFDLIKMYNSQFSFVNNYKTFTKKKLIELGLGIIFLQNFQKVYI